MRKYALEIIMALMGAALLVIGAIANADAAESVSATATCNGKYVVVKVDEPDTVQVLGRREGGVWIAYGNHFVPDTGGGNAAGDYDITIELQAEGRTGSVRTPNCGPVSLPLPATIVIEPTTPVVIIDEEPVVIYPEWVMAAIVEAVAGIR